MADGTADRRHEASGAKQGLSRRQLLAAGAATGAAPALVVGSGTAAAADGGGRRAGNEGRTDLILVNGKIHTMDANNTIVSSVAIRDGRFAAVGDGARARGPGTRVINLKGRTVVPGIIDNHNHIVVMGLRPGYHTPLENADSIAEVQETIAARRADVSEGQFITTIGGFHPNQFSERRLPTRSELDAVVPDRPVYLQIAFAGPSTTNSPGKAFFEARGVTVADDGSIASGTQSGTALLRLREMQGFEDQQRSTLDAMAYATSLGVTTHLDQGAFPASGTANDGAAHADLYTMHDAFLALHRKGKLSVRLRINFLHLESDPEVPALRARLRNAFPFFGGPMVKTGGIGEFTAQGLGDAWLAGTRQVARAGWRNENHSLSRTDFQTIIEGWETVDAEFPIGALRWVLAHVPFISEDYVDRLKALGGGLSLTGWRYLAGTAARNGPPFRMIVDNGIPTGMSSDGMQIAPMNPWLHMYYAVTARNARGDLINDGQQITRQEVLRLYTANNGWFNREEGTLGSIESGKCADLVVLDRDYFSVPHEDIKDVTSVLTVVGGDIVHDEGVVR